jgi:hypothetical protein
MCLALHVCKTEHTHQGRHSQLAHCRTGHVSHLPHTFFQAPTDEGSGGYGISESVFETSVRAGTAGFEQWLLTWFILMKEHAERPGAGVSHVPGMIGRGVPCRRLSCVQRRQSKRELGNEGTVRT